MGYSGVRGTLIYEKNLKSKISCQTPFKRHYIVLCYSREIDTLKFNNLAGLSLLQWIE
jgi:hypothetical protein